MENIYLFKKSSNRQNVISTKKHSKMSTHKDFVTKTIKIWNEFEDEHHQDPKKLFLTLKEEVELLGALPSISPQLAEQAFVKGVRRVLPKIFGFEVVYRADRFHVE
jgi:hypothetical protein